MEIKRKLAKLSPFFQSAVVIAISVLFVCSIVYAATTIGSSITTGGNLTVTGWASSTSATTTNYLIVGSEFTLPSSFDYTEDLAVSGDAVIKGTATATTALWVGTGTADNLDLSGGDLFVQDDIQAGDGLWANAASTTGSLYAGGYASTTGGLFTQGNFYSGANATTSGHYSFGSATEYLRVELEPLAVAPSYGSIPWLKGSSLANYGDTGPAVNIFGIETGLFIRESGDALYPEPSIIFVFDTALEASKIYANTDDDSLRFANALGGYSFDGTMSVGGTAAANIGLDVSMGVTLAGSDIYGISLTSALTPVDGYSAYGAYINPSLALSAGKTHPIAANLYVDGGSVGSGGTITNYYGLYVDEPSTAGSTAATNKYGAYIGGTTLLGGNASTTGDLFVSGSTLDLTTSTGTTTPGIFVQDLTNSTSTVSAGVITDGATKTSVGCLELAADNGAYYHCFINTATPSLVCVAGRCN